MYVVLQKESAYLNNLFLSKCIRQKTHFAHQFIQKNISLKSLSPTPSAVVFCTKPPEVPPRTQIMAIVQG